MRYCSNFTQCMQLNLFCLLCIANMLLSHICWTNVHSAQSHVGHITVASIRQSNTVLRNTNFLLVSLLLPTATGCSLPRETCHSTLPAAGTTTRRHQTCVCNAWWTCTSPQLPSVMTQQQQASRLCYERQPPPAVALSLQALMMVVWATSWATAAGTGEATANVVVSTDTVRICANNNHSIATCRNKLPVVAYCQSAPVVHVKCMHNLAN
jgi:hypothetical protein